MAESSHDKVIYLDYNATTNIHEEERKAMEPYLSINFRNPSSSHKYGIQTKKGIVKARNQIATMLNCSSSEIIITSGASESNNYANKGIINYYFHNTHSPEKISVITSSIEHPSVMEIYPYLKSIYKDKLEIITLPCDSDGIINLDAFKNSIQKNTLLISIMLANNETGCVQPIKEIREIAKKINPDCIVHTDASQALGKIPVDVKNLGVDLLTVAGHKIYGPKGIGALYIKTGIEKKLEKIIHGASHENNLRAGTENVLEIVGLGEACGLISRDLNKRMRQFMITRNIIYKIISEKIPKNNYVLHGPEIDFSIDINKLNDKQLYELVNKEKRLTNTLYISFPGIEANLILDKLSDKIACSAGAACHSEGVHMSHVLQAMKVSPQIAMGTLRISTGISTTEKDAEESAKSITEIVLQLMPKNNNLDNQNNLLKYVKEDQEAIDNCRLTKNTHGMGCGCKISPKLLQEVLSSLPIQKCIPNDKNILVDNSSFDDGSVYNLTPFYISTNANTITSINKEIALVSTLDFFTPICDNPYDFGAISCSNALSDIYAMGAKPINALSIVAFPITLLPKIILKEILRGAQDKADEAKCPILGGHSIDDNEPKFGLSVNGIVEKNKIWKNNSLKKDNYILLTKKIGTGVIMTSLKKDIVDKNEQCVKDAINIMKSLNKYHCELVTDNNINIDACTDITGFGLLGHLSECLLGEENKNLIAEIYYNKIKFISDKVNELTEMGMTPGGAKSNLSYVDGKVDYDKKMTENEKLLINDPQTSGGLLMFMGEEDKNKMEKLCQEKNLECYEIGKILEKNDNIDPKYCIKVIKN